MGSLEQSAGARLEWERQLWVTLQMYEQFMEDLAGKVTNLEAGVGNLGQGLAGVETGLEQVENATQKGFDGM